jgi:hypothetical protein
MTRKADNGIAYVPALRFREVTERVEVGKTAFGDSFMMRTWPNEVAR